jgi:uroporphyrinogen decarboxylase
LPDFSEGIFMMLPAGYPEVPPYEQGGKDWFGVQWRAEKPAAIPDPTAPRVLTDITKWREQVIFPDLEYWDWEQAVKLDRVDTIDRANKLFEVLIKEGPFERIHSLMGMTEAFEALLTESEELEALATAITDFKCRLIDKIAAHYKPDIINYHDDYGTQKNMMFAPGLWRQIFKPLMKRVVDACHSHGIIFDLHSCGLIEPIIPDLSEIGVDCLNCMAINNIPEMKRLTNDKLAFLVTFDMQKYEIADRVGLLKEAEFRSEIRNTIAAYGKNGNFIPFHFPGGQWYNTVITEELDNARYTIYP